MFFINISEALNIDFVRITRRHKFNDDARTCGHCEKHHEKYNRSVPLIRKYSKEECTSTQQPGNCDSNIVNSEDLYNEESEIDKLGNLDSGELDIKRTGNSENLESEKTDIDTDNLDSSAEHEKMHRRDIPRRFKSESSEDSEIELSSSYDSMQDFSNSVGLKIRRFPKYSDKEYSEPNYGIHSTGIEFQKLQFVENIDSRQDIDKGVVGQPECFESSSDNLNSNRDEGYAMLRTKSYRKAIENQKHAFKDANNVMSRSNSFQSAIKQGHVNLTRSYNTPYMRASDLTPEYESSDSLLSNSSPKFSSTPLPTSAIRSVHCDEGNCNKTDPQCTDTAKMTKLRNTENEPLLIESVQAELFKASGLNPNK